MAIGRRDHWCICLGGLVGAEVLNGIRALVTSETRDKLFAAERNRAMGPGDSGKRKDELS